MEAMVYETPITLVLAGPLEWQGDAIPWTQIGDEHIGMLANAAKVGENFDVKIAKSKIRAAFGI